LREILSDASLLSRVPNQPDKYIAISQGNFPTQFKAIDLLHKVSFLLARQPIASTEDLDWLIANDWGILRLVDLPIESYASGVSLAQWVAFTNWRALVDQFPEPEGASWREVIEEASQLEAFGTISGVFWVKIGKLTQWPTQQYESFQGLQALGLTAGIGGDRPPVTAFCHLIKAMKAVRRLGVNVTVAQYWTNRDTAGQETIASQIRDTAKSKHDDLTWLEKAAPIQNELREKKRAALCRFLVEHSLRNESQTITIKDRDQACPTGRNPKYWTDTNDLIRYFLLDVEMGADQLTSRIKQAMSSVQMFVQRCFQNLERPRVQVSPKEKKDTGSANSWRQWQYMKSYQMWQAARKVLLYPENWIEPELRPNKSPFFEELESELAKDEMTEEHAEDCFRHFMEKVHEVSRLDVIGAYHEVNAEQDDLRDLLHVVARTKADPAIFYYRAFNGIDGTWSPWEKIDADITGEHVHPVVYNRKLYLFWLVFLEKPQKAYKQPSGKTSDKAKDSPETPKQIEIQLAWTQRKDDGWLSKTLSREKLIHPWDRPFSAYQLVPQYKNEFGENELWLDLFISSSKEFNDATFYNPFIDQRTRQANSPYKETVLPWHSSSFVFNGAVTGVKMRGFDGWYHQLDGSDSHGSDMAKWPAVFPVGNIDINLSKKNAQQFALGQIDFDEAFQKSFKDKWGTFITKTSSVKYINDAFGEAGRAIKALNTDEIASDRILPNWMHYRYNRLTNNAGNNRLSIAGNPNPLAICPPVALPFELIVLPEGSRLLYQDQQRSFFGLWREDDERAGYSFFPFYHPYTALFLRELGRDGIDGLLQRKIQTKPENFSPVSSFNFGSYDPRSPNEVDKSALKECVDFARSGAYAIYNWEAFFHAPFLIACRLSQNQRFEEAMRWFHYIFDPTNVEERESPKRFWVTKPFYEENSEGYRKQRIQELLQNLSDKSKLAEIQAWRNDPFNPHRIAEHRPVAYQRAVVMRYIDNLIAWGDQLFRRDTMESINEATTLYLLAYEILGPRPIKVPDVDRAALSYADLAAGNGFDLLGNTSVPAAVESFVSGPDRLVFKPVSSAVARTSVAANLASKMERLAPKSKKKKASTPKIVATQAVKSVSGIAKLPRCKANAEPLPLLNLYFRIPSNDELLGRWDLVEDRLFKIRHSLNIDGIFRQLPLFEPPIDPALLVKASAAGVDIASALSQTDVDPGQYRFRTMLAKAIEYCAEVRGLGEKLLSTLEKRDAEELAVLRSSHETHLLEASRQVRMLQISEAKEALAGLEKAKQQAEARCDFYQGREFINALEETALSLSGQSAAGEAALALGHILASGLSYIPAFVVGAAGWAGTPKTDATILKGEALAEAAKNQISAMRSALSAMDKLANLASTMGSYQRRQEDWEHQAKLAQIDVAQIDRQIAAAELRQAIAERELQNLELQIEKAKTVEEYYKSKYTNKQLYDWMLEQISTVYFGSYKLAHDLALRAQKCLRFELGNDELSFIEFGYWDSLKKGLLAGEKLGYDLRRMESAYLDLNKREFELTKHISMAEVMPLELLKLKTTGKCDLKLPEWLFDMDFPGHYRRRIKSVSITIPCVLGAYSGVYATLSLTKNMVRANDSSGALDGSAPSVKAMSSLVATKSIATSEAQHDSGVFELNFNDERYLPFEGAGVISEWKLDMPKDSNQFDFDNISDVILHLRYTAVAGNAERTLPNTCAVLLDLKSAFSNEWQLFQDQTPGLGEKRVLEFELEQHHLPFFVRNKVVNVSSLHLALTNADIVQLTPPDSAPLPPITCASNSAGSFVGTFKPSSSSSPSSFSVEGEWQAAFDVGEHQGAYLVIELKISTSSGT
jgi:hypothetical protein